MQRPLTLLRWLGAALGVILLVAIVAWLARARLAAEFARSYFHQHGIASSVEIGALGLSGVSGRVVLGPADAPDFSADRIEVHFDPLRWTPFVVEVRLVHPVVRAAVDAQGRVTLGSLQEWINSLGSDSGSSPFVSDDLVVSLSGLEAFLTTPAGALAVEGDVRLVKNLPVTAALRVRPGTLRHEGQTLTIAAANVSFQQKTQGAALRAHLEGAYEGAGIAASALVADVSSDDARWSLDGAPSFAAPQAHLTLRAARLQQGALAAEDVSLELTAENPSLQSAGNTLAIAAPQAQMTLHAAILHQDALQAQDVSLNMTAQNAALHGTDAGADLKLVLSAGVAPQTQKSLLAPLQFLARDKALYAAVARTLSKFDLTLAGRAAHRAGAVHFALSEPLLLKTTSGATVRVATLALDGPVSAMQGNFGAALSGGGLPPVTLNVSRLTLNDGAVNAVLTLQSRFSFDMLQNADVTLAGTAALKGGAFRLALTQCAPVKLAALRVDARDLASAVSATLCAAGATPLIAADENGWSVTADARGAALGVPQGPVEISGAAGRIAFAGRGSAPPHGTVTLTAGLLTDAADGPRVRPLGTTGTITLDGDVLKGRIAPTRDGHALGAISFSHDLAKSAGSAHIAAPAIGFTDGGFQPEDISPLAATLKHAQGKIGFDGTIAWTAGSLTSHGTLDMSAFDFLTPLGRAHGVNTRLELTSLLPPMTADDQEVAIARIDGTLPFSGIEVRFALDPETLNVRSAATDIAQGHVALGALAIKLAAPGHIAGGAELSGIALAPLVEASNLGTSLKLEGNISGHVPFTVGPEGFRITDGHVAADGPGRISIDRALWTQGEPAANLVQDFAYQALEYLAFDTLTADINSIANGRLQVVFHIKGHSDPPQAQTAEVAVMDIINGTALSKPVPLPNGTPIDLTLDTSLNFDELLKSYAEAWSKTLEPTP